MASTEQFFQRLSGIIVLSEELKSVLDFNIRQEQYKAHQILLATGQIDTRFCYIASGLVRNYYFDRDGREHTTRFWNEGQIVFSHEGYLKKPATEYLEVLEPSTLFTLTYDHLRDLMSQYKEIIPIIDFFDQRYREGEQLRNRLFAFSAEERYKQYRKLNPQIFRRVPLRMIASYLNITREGLSRIMSRD